MMNDPDFGLVVFGFAFVVALAIVQHYVYKNAKGK